jgi:hypothetical protein
VYGGDINLVSEIIAYFGYWQEITDFESAKF